MKLSIKKILCILAITLLTICLSFQKKGKNMKNANTKNKKSNKSNKFHKNRQVNIVSDRTGFGSDVGVLVRKNPTVFVDNKYGLARLESPQQFNSFSNSNTSNLPNVGGYGKTAEIVNPTILFHSNSPATIVKTQPAHLGYRNEKSTITSFNKQTGRVETHDVVNKTPIMGEIESVHTVHVDSVKPYDLQYRRFRKPRTVVRDNGEMEFQRNERFVNE